MRLPAKSPTLSLAAAILAAVLLAEAPAAAQVAADDNPNSQQATDLLALEQSRIADNYRSLEQLMIRMAEFELAENPQRASLLRRAAQQSSERLTRSQLDQITRLLEPPSKLQLAIEDQQAVLEDMRGLLDLLLSEDRADRLKRERDRIRGYIKDIEKLIRWQRGLQGQTERSGDLERLADDQQKVADRTGELSDRIREDEGIPAQDGDPRNGDAAEGAPDQSRDGEGQPSEGEPSEGEPSEGEPSEGEPSEGEPSEGEPSEGEPSEGQPSKGQPSKGQPSEGQPSEGQPSEGQPSEGQPSEGQPSEGQPSEGQPSEGQPSEGQPSEGQPSSQNSQSPPPQNPAQQRIEAARARMQQAQQRLAEADRQDAAQEQEAARRELELAKAELEQILRQLREEEVERALASLEERFRRMLEEQLSIYDATQQLDQIASEQRTRDIEIQVSKLSFRESKLVLETDRALTLLRDEGSSVAFPESVEQMRDDMQEVAERLDNLQVGPLTQSAEEAVIDALQEMIEALQRAQEELEQQRQNSQQQPSSADPSEVPLVDQLAELKMIRALQMRVNTRTQRCASLLSDPNDPTGWVADGEIRETLARLSERQQRIYEVTRDIELGKNK